MVKSDRASIRIPELDFEIPACTQRGVFTTLEGVLDRAIENLEGSQVARRAVDAGDADAVGAFIERLRRLRNAEAEALPFTVILDDPSGNSFLENLAAPRPDPALRQRNYVRTLEQNHAMGMYAENTQQGGGGEGEEAVGGAGQEAPAALEADLGDTVGDTGALAGSAARTSSSGGARLLFPARPLDLTGNLPDGRFKKGGALIRPSGPAASRARGGAVRGSDGRLQSLVFDSSHSDAAKEVMRFPADCFGCSAAGECRMCVTDVPHFKEVILMAFACEECGWKDVEVKGGGAMPPSGTLTELSYDPAAPDAAGDMSRDVIKSDTAAVEIPEVELVMEGGSLGGMYTTVEGLLTALLDKLLEGNPFMSHSADSAEDSRRSAFDLFTERLTAVRDGAVPFTLRLRDPLANSWIYSPTAPEPDPRLRHEPYARTHEENLELGILDMRVEGYGETIEEEEEAGGGGGAGGRGVQG